MKKSIQVKITVFVSIIIASILLLQTTIEVLSLQKEAEKIVVDHTTVVARELSHFIQSEVELTLVNARSVAYTFASVKDEENPFEISRDEGFTILRNVLKGESKVLNAYTLWEPNAFDGKDEQYKNVGLYDGTGRYIANVIRDGQNFVYETPLDYETEGAGDYYLIPVKTKKEAIIDPYIYSLNNKDVLMISCVAPILYENNVYGEVGMDISVDFINSLVNNVEWFDDAVDVLVLSNNGTIVANLSDSSSYGKSIVEYYSEEECENLFNIIENNKEEIITSEDFISFYAPINFGLSETTWFVKIDVPTEVVNKAIRKMMFAKLLLGLFFLIISITILYFILKRITKPIIKLSEISEKISAGDLNIEIDVNQQDEIGQLANSLRKIIANFKKIISNVQSSSQALLNAGNQLSSNSQQMTHSAAEQAATIEEVSSAMEEILETINSNTDKAENTSNISTTAAQEMSRNKELIFKSLNSVLDISQRISIISEIADKTDILSINAAIEAARAGDAGKGFAVVAHEIRKLADKTKNASVEIEELSKVNQTITQISTKQLEKSIPKIIESAELVNNIVIASKEQTISVEAINNSILQLTSTTNENSASAEELSAQAEELSAQAAQLKDLVSVFKI